MFDTCFFSTVSLLLSFPPCLLMFPPLFSWLHWLLFCYFKALLSLSTLLISVVSSQLLQWSYLSVINYLFLFSHYVNSSSTRLHTHTHTHTKKNTVKFRYSYYMYFNNRFVKKVNWGLFKLWWQLSLGCYRNYKSRLQIAHLWFIYKIISTSNKCVVRFSLFCLKYWSWQNQMSTVITQIINELCAWNNEIYAHLVSSISHVHI